LGVSAALWAARRLEYKDAATIFRRAVPRPGELWPAWAGDHLEKAIALHGRFAREIWLRHGDVNEPGRFARYKRERLTAARMRKI
jgi:hypothetical protein